MAVKKESFNCDKCSFATYNHDYLINHSKRVHDKIKNHKCELCNYEAFSRSEIDLHVRNLHLYNIGKEKLKCGRCDYSSLYKSTLLRHNKCHHPKEDQEYLKCTECPKKFAGLGD